MEAPPERVKREFPTAVVVMLGRTANIQHPTSNARHPMKLPPCASGNWGWVFGVGCFLPLALRKRRKIGIDHDLHELFEAGLRFPAQLCLGLGRITDEQVHLGGTL